MTDTVPIAKKLFAVYLGGRAARCNTELHDVAFVVGESIEACYERLMDKWFGDPLRLHIDSWIELRTECGGLQKRRGRCNSGTGFQFFGHRC